MITWKDRAVGYQQFIPPARHLETFPIHVVRARRIPRFLWFGVVLCSSLLSELTSSPCAEAKLVPQISVATNLTGLVTMEGLDDAHKLALGDRLSFRIVEERDESKPVIVTDSGEIEVPYVGRIQAIDKTCRQVAEEIKALLEKDYYRKATVILAVDFFSRNRGKIYVIGRVRAPGPQELPGDELLTLSKAIWRAGGLSEFADKKRVKLTRKGSAGNAEGKTILVDVSEIWEKGKTDKDIALDSGDVIFVPDKLLSF